MESNKILVLQFGNKNNFISEMLYSLLRSLAKPFNSNFLAILQCSLINFPKTSFS